MLHPTNQYFHLLYFDLYYFPANSHESVTECLRRLLNNSEVNSIVSEAINEGGQESVVTCYLHDFVHMVYKPHDEDDLEVKFEIHCVPIEWG